MKTGSLKTRSGRGIFGRAAGIAALLFAAFIIAACSTDSGEPSNWNTETLANAVYGGTNPGGAWVTITFRNDGKMIGAFSGDNTSNEWDYTCDNGNGSITSAGWTPGAFTLSQDGAVLTFVNFGGHGGEKIFNRLRTPDLTAAAGPADLAPLEPGLAGSVWGGPTPAGEGTSWLTLTFRARRSSGYENDDMNGANVAVISYAHDNTTAVWEYSYNDAARAGTAFTNGRKPDGTSTTWNPGAYTVSGDGKKITFTSFMGTELSFNRYFQQTAE